MLRDQNNLEMIRLNFNPQFNAGRHNQQIFNNKNLRVFECIGCGFDDIESEYFAGLTNLTELRLNRNQINKIFLDAFRSNRNLTLLDLSENQVDVIEPKLFSTLTKFEILILSKNPISIPKSSALLKSNSIKTIQLDNCNVTTIYAETFSQLSILETLNLTGNLISILPATSFSSINLNLKSLFVEDNRITTFPLSMLESTAKAKGLRELCIDKNNFEDTLEFEKLVKMYVKLNLRSANCQSDLSYFIEKMNFESKKIGSKNEKNPGISDFFIGSYITLIIICQAVAVVVLLFYYIKISKYEKFEGGVNYANTILNDDEIYKVFKFNDE
jgi:Leucine-rich repeat (LRR) protein